MSGHPLRASVMGIGLLMCVVRPVAAAQTVNHRAWDQLLHRYVKDGRVDYDAFLHERDVLMLYLGMLGNVHPEQLSHDEQLAFWINAYNACVIKGVFEHSPFKSVKDVRGFFDKVRYHVAGRDLTLNEIEAQGRALHDWRIHFAVVCASLSCPDLRNEAYVPERIYDQLEDQTRHFIQDSRRGLRIEGDTLWASQIFTWYAKDFLPSEPLTAANLLKRVAPYAIPVMKQPPGWRYPNPSRLKFLSYDWSLNMRRER